MKKSFFCVLVCVCSMIIFSSLTINAQIRNEFDQEPDTAPVSRPKKPNLLRELQLTPDQIQQIRQINQERRRNRLAAQSRLKSANEALDAAVYGERDSDAEVESRLRDVHAAQLEVLRNRVSSEQSVRRVLTSQQLGKFRRLQRQFNQKSNQTSTVENGLNQRQNRTLNQRQQQRIRRLANRQRRQGNP